MHEPKAARLRALYREKYANTEEGDLDIYSDMEQEKGKRRRWQKSRSRSERDPRGRSNCYNKVEVMTSASTGVRLFGLRRSLSHTKTSFEFDVFSHVHM